MVMTPQLAPLEGSRSVLSGGQGSIVEGGILGLSLCYPVCPLHPTNGPCLQVRSVIWAPIGAF